MTPWVLAALVAGCVSLRSPIVFRSTMTAQYTETELRGDLVTFANHFEAVVSATADRIADASSDRAVRKRALLWKIRLIPLVQQAVFLEEPQEAFAAVLILTVTMRQYLEQGEGRETLGERHALALDAARSLEADALQIGARFLKPDELQRATADVTTFARENPIRGADFTAQRLHRDVQTLHQRGVLSSVINAPMAPFRALEGVSSGADAILEFNRTAEQFAQIVAGLPRQLSWETELLLYDLEDRDTVTEGLAAFVGIGDSIRRVSEAADRLPADLQRALEDSRGAIAEADQAIASARALVGPLTATAEQITQASAIWERILVKDERSAAPPGRPFDVREWESALRETGVAADRLHALATELRGLVDSDHLDATVQRLTATLDGAEARTREVVDLAAWRVLQLIVAFFALLLAYRLVILGIGRSRSRADR